jgi:serine protease Do
VVSEVFRGGPGDKGGIRRLDVITAVNATPVRSSEELVIAISSHRAGETVKVTVFREGKLRELKAVLGDRQEIVKEDTQDENDDQDPAPRAPSQEGRTLDLGKSYGFTVEALTPFNRHQNGIAQDWNGVLVTYVSPRSAAADKGLRAGLVIAAVGTRSIEGLQDFQQEVRKAGGKKPILLLVRVPRGDGGRGGAALTIAVPPQ